MDLLTGLWLTGVPQLVLFFVFVAVVVPIVLSVADEVRGWMS